MSLSDPVADFLTRIRNATMRRHGEVMSPASRLKHDIARVLKEEGFIEEFTAFRNQRGLPWIGLDLKYDDRGDPVIRGLHRVSRPGLRSYVGYREMDPVLNGQGIAIVSTSRGVMTDFACREAKVGGEVLCHIW